MEEFSVNKKMMIRAGATYPNAVPGSWAPGLQSSGNEGGKNCRRNAPSRVLLTSNRNTRPRPAFGATRDEGAIGTIVSLSPYAEAAVFTLQGIRRSAEPKKHSEFGNKMTCRSNEPPQTAAKGPTAENIISMTAAGRKPPVPEEEQVARHKKSLLQISSDMQAAVSELDEKETLKSDDNLDARIENDVLLQSDRIPGFQQTWGTAFKFS